MRRLIPDYVADQYRAGRTRGQLRAAGIFVDLSGFSKMADALARHGQPGAEALAEVMCAIFEPLVGAVYAQAGFVVGYAGDAFTAVFPDEAGNSPAALRCLAAVQAIQSHTRARPSVTTPFGRFPIFVKVGLGFGQVDWLILRSSDGRRATCCMRGACVDEAVEAEGCAQPGEVLLSEAAYQALRTEVQAAPVRGCYRLTSVHGDLPASLPITEPLPAPDLQGVFYPGELASLPDVGEFRQVVNLFIDIPIDPSNEAFVKPFMESVFDLQERYGGVFLRPDIGDKGFNLLIFWGAPTAHENDVERALGFMLELFERTGLPFKAGVTYLAAYAGFMGAPLREDYTAYGWGVNLAARFMGMAGAGQVWLDEETARLAEKHFSVRYLDDFVVKGFAGRQKAYQLLGRKKLAETVYRGALVGREAELERLAQFFAPLRDGKFCGALVIRGEAGIGKSRLAHACQVSDFFASTPARWIVCQSDEILRQSFNPFRDWLQGRFGYREGEANESNLEHFERELQGLAGKMSDPLLASELVRTASVLAALLGLSSPGSLYEQLDAKGRYENLFIALGALLRAESLQSPLVIFIEDLQWLDEDTRAFLPYLVRTLLAEPGKEYPIAILGTQRLEGPGLRFDEALAFQTLDLERLAPVHLSRLARGVLGASVSPRLLRLLESRAEGNPFFAEQILRYLAEKEMLSLKPDGRYDTLDDSLEALPLEVGAVLMARLDSLAREERAVVQTAAVLGREFELRLLANMLSGMADLPHKIASAERADIWFPLDEIRYMFCHAMLRDAAYAMQLRTRQRRLHALAVTTMEVLYSGEITSHSGELAYHAERAGLVEQARLYLNLAGETAAGAYRNALAVDYFSRALRFIPPAEGRARFDLLVKRERLYGIMGERALQRKDLTRLRLLAQRLGDEASLVRVWVLYARYYFNAGEFVQADEYARRAADSELATGDVETILDGYAVWPLALLRLGRLHEAMQKVEDGLALARRAGHRILEGYIANSAGLIALEQKNPAAASRFLEDALSIARETGERTLEARSLNNLANVAGFVLGDYVSAREYYRQAYAIVHERGDRVAEGIALTNLGWVSGVMGDLPAARSYQRQALSLAREVGNRYQEAYALINLSAAAVVQGDAPESLRYARQAHELVLTIGERSAEGWALFCLGHAYLLCDDVVSARDMFQRSIAIREELEQPGPLIESVAGLAQAALAADDIPTAREYIETILTHLTSGGTLEGAEEPLRVHLVCYQVLMKAQDPRSGVVLRTAIQHLETQVSKLSGEKARRMYIDHIPWRRALWQAWQSTQAGLV
ncbi:MAG: AAA family ATPase [Chloroflexota bacterium]